MSRYDLVGINGNAFSVMGYVIRAMKECKFTQEDINKYKFDAMSSDYDHLLMVSFSMVEKCNEISGYDEEWD